MSIIIQIAVTMLVAWLGYFIADKIKIPASPLIGSLFGVALFNVITDMAYLPDIRLAIQILAGILIGSRTTKKDLIHLKGVYKPILINLVITILYSLTFGIILAKFSDVNFQTAAFGTAPGGIIDISLIAMDLGADISVVSTLQIVRFLTVIAVFPLFSSLVLRKYSKKNDLKKDEQATINTDVSVNYETEVIKTGDKSMEFESNKLELDNQSDNTCRVKSNNLDRFHGNNIFTAFLSIFIGIVAGLVGYATGIPAMAMIFTMIASSAQNIMWGNTYLPERGKVGTQLIAGIMIGQTITMTALLSLGSLIIPAIFIMIGYLIMITCLALIMYRATDMNFPTAMFACAPGGATDMVLLCGDFGGNPTLVSLIQYPRVFVVIGSYPLIVTLLNNMLK